jgi:hypothetical protein
VPHTAILSPSRRFHPLRGQTLPKMMPEACGTRRLRAMCLLGSDRQGFAAFPPLQTEQARFRALRFPVGPVDSGRAESPLNRLPFSKPMIEILFSLRMAPMVFEKRLLIRRLWSYQTDRRQGRVCRDGAATLRQNKSTTPCL